MGDILLARFDDAWSFLKKVGASSEKEGGNEEH